MVRRGAHVIGLNRLARCLNWWVARPRSGTHDLALLAWGPAPPIAKNNWADRVELDFGPDRFWAPQGYESVLAGSFGPDYRKPYPAELRVNPHHFQAFREGADDWLRIADEGDAAPGRAS